MLAPVSPSSRIGLVDPCEGTAAKGSSERPSCWRVGFAFAMSAIVVPTSTFETSVSEICPAGMPGPRIIIGTWLEGSCGRYLPWRMRCSPPK